MSTRTNKWFIDGQSWGKLVLLNDAEPDAAIEVSGSRELAQTIIDLLNRTLEAEAIKNDNT
jgi:hypothetical protein